MNLTANVSTSMKYERDRFLLQYNPNAQKGICTDKRLCFFGRFPTLTMLNNAYGKNFAIVWLIPQITDVSEFCGCKDKITPAQVEQCATLIAQNYFYLKISELMLFFNRFKSGVYGRFYGSVDPFVIIVALRDFMRERNDAYFDHENEKEREKAAKQREGTMTYEEWKRLKNKS